MNVSILTVGTSASHFLGSCPKGQFRSKQTATSSSLLPLIRTTTVIPRCSLPPGAESHLCANYGRNYVDQAADATRPPRRPPSKSSRIPVFSVSPRPCRAPRPHQGTHPGGRGG